MNDAQALYDVIMDFLEINPEMTMVEVMGVFEIIKLQYRDQIEEELNQEGIE